MPPVSSLDVATYILDKKGRMSTWKLQKLVYYSQAWSLVWDEEPLIADPIEAWANGPVAPRLYGVHRGRFQISTLRRGDAKTLDKDQRETVNAVLKYYGKRTGQWLSDLTHRETPWVQARAGLPPGVRGGGEITQESMAEYYGAL